MVQRAKDQLNKNKNDDSIVGALLSGGTTNISSTVVPCSIPSGAIGFRLYPTTNDIRFAIDEDPVTAGTVNAATVGAIAKSGAWEKRLVIPNASEVRLLGTTETDVDIEWF